MKDQKFEHCDQCGIWCHCEACWDEDDWEEMIAQGEWELEEEEDEEPRSDTV